MDRLVRQGDEVTVFDTGRHSYDEVTSRVPARYLTGDIRDASSLEPVITKDVDIVYHLAAVVGVDLYLNQPLDVIDTNFTGARNVFERAVRADAKVVLASTSEVSGRNPVVPWTEEADRVLGSTSVTRWSYSSSKALAEHAAFAFMSQHGLDATIVRYFNLYGPRQRPRFLISRSLHRCLRGLAPVVFDDGKQTRTFTFIDDAVEATVRIGADSASSGECFNVGSSTEMTIQQAVDTVVEMTGSQAGVEVVDTRKSFGDTYQDLSRRIPDTTKLRQRIGSECGTELREGVAKTLRWARENPWWLEQKDSSAA